MTKFSWKKKLLLSYIFVGVIPLLVLGSFFYYGTKVSNDRKIEESNSAMLFSVLQKLDYMVEKMNSAAYHFSGTEMADTLGAVRNNEKILEDGTIISQLATYSEIVGEEEMIASTILYLRGDKYIYTQEGRIPYITFEEEMEKYGDLNQVAFFSTINSINSNISIQVNRQKENAMLYFLYPIPYMNSIPVATIGFGFDSHSMEKLINTYYPLASEIYLFDERMINIFSQEGVNGISEEDRERLKERAYELRKTGREISREKIGGKEYVILRKISANTGFVLVSLTPVEEFYLSLNSLSSWFGVLLGILVVSGVLLSLVLSKHNYKPVQNLLNKMIPESEKKEPTGLSRNEFEMINEQWEDIRNKNEELNALVNRQRPMVVASCLRKLLKGRYKTREEMEASLKSAAINLKYRYHFVILLPIPVEEGFDQEKNIKILYALQENGLPNVHMYGLDMLKDDGIAVIVNCQELEDCSEQKDIRLFVTYYLQQVLQKRYELNLSFYVGRIYGDPMEISRSFIETTVIAADYRGLGDQKIILFEEIGQEEEDISYPVLEQAVYIQCLKQANEEAALKALENMVHEIEPIKSFVMTQCLCFDIINIIIKTVDQMKGFECKDVDIKKICSFMNLADFYEKAIELTKTICRQYSTFKDSRNNEMKSGILNYVNKHFVDSNMGLDTVAEEFGISANYLSRFFKQETGCTFIQYVTMIRMDRARELLINSDMQIKDIVTEIGYIDVANFVRKFKNYEGVTPGQYRERMRSRV